MISGNRTATRMASLLVTLASLTALSRAQELDLSSLPVLEPRSARPARGDWLVEAPESRARACRSADGRELVLDNGLVRRVWRVAPNGACVAFDNLMTGESLLRAVRPEARIEVNLYYTGLTDTALVRHEGREGVRLPLARDCTISLEATVPPGGMTWYSFEE